MSNIVTDGYGSSFSVCEFIGKGSFSNVYSLKCSKTEKQFAGKFISMHKLNRCGIKHKVWDEINIHKILRHENIVQFITYIIQHSHIVIVLEYCSKYSLVNILHALKFLTLGEAKYFMVQIVSAVEYLHKNKIVHRDLKLGNLFVNKQLGIKLGDFGLAVVIEYEGQKRFSRCGTPNYIAPEVITGNGHSYETDIWALGCILHTMLEGTPPFQAQNTTSTYNNILRGQYMFSQNNCKSAQNFILTTLQLDPAARPSIFYLKNSDFLVSTEILPKPPKFCFGENEKLSLVKKRGRVSTQTNLRETFVVKETGTNDYLKNCFIKLSKDLSKVKDWAESKFAEFLSETSVLRPLVWVNSWIDYSNSYGFAYMLSNNNYGIIFNDCSRLLFLTADQAIHYMHTDGNVRIFKKSFIPSSLNKKVKILSICESYMRESLLKAHEAKVPETKQRESSVVAEVFKWYKGSGEVAMFFTNGSIQVNFLSDHTKVILCGVTNTATVIESASYMKSLKIHTLRSCGCSEQLKHKLEMVLRYVDRYLSE